MQHPSNREREKHNRDQSNFGLQISWPKGFSLKNPWITHLITACFAGFLGTSASKHHDKELDTIYTEIKSYEALNVTAHANLNARIDSNGTQIDALHRQVSKIAHKDHISITSL